MSEWWTYRPSDFLMFAPRTYWRLFELHNEALWPVPWLAALLALGLAVALWQGRTGAVRSGLALLAACWAGVAWAFLWQRYAPINTAAGAFAIAFAVQAAGLLVLAGWGGLRRSHDTTRWRTGLALLAGSVLLHPWLATVAGRPWSQAEFFGLAPDPTAIGTLGVLLCLTTDQPTPRGLLVGLRVLACMWCVVSASTLWTMGSMQGWVPALCAALALALAPQLRRRG